jgi:hypothetical protein
MVAPLDPIRGPSTTPPNGAPRPTTGAADAFELEFQRLLKAPETSEPPRPAAAASVGLGDDLTASLDGVSESLKRATAYINSARAYFKGAPAAQTAPDADTSLDTKG